MKLKSIFHIKKSRKYPIKRDNEGLSLRARCFELFEQGKRPVAVAGELGMEESNSFRYFRDWKRLGPNFERKCAYVKGLFNKMAPDRDQNIELFARAWGIEKEQLESVLSQPRGLRRLLMGKFHFPAHPDADHKRYVILELALLISDHIIKRSGKFVDFYHALKRYMQENMKYREQEDADIEEENKTMALIHQVLAADMENERRGRIQPDTISNEERDAIIRFGIESEMKKTEQLYWLRIGIYMAGGLNPEEAREKMYQDLLDKGHSKGAKMFREFQDKIHPLKKDDQLPPSTPLQPPSPT